MNALVSSSPAFGEFLVYDDGVVKGPFSAADLRAKLHDGELGKATPCRARREREWHDLAFVVQNLFENGTAAGGGAAPAAEGCSAGAGVSAFDAGDIWRQPGVPDPTREGGETLQGIVAALVETNARHSRHLAGIKWSLAATAVSAVAAVLLFAWLALT